ncbi:hypothetical protein [Ruminiclostridium papyrosolvens]|uniref:Uncharacterized protein n=1 Tax=Ruminiclostridium papyrosolvens C7 TaxID=1330534 RepID=U4R4Q2_9FIRM|nr:hypothetical protein [Ruminiclostridium papyrosolvens]EPR12848.1 hypothetical protein L323_06960 [Ruminiclostridium papyrosolvens C7]
MKYESIIKEYFSSIFEKYDLDYRDVTENSVAFIGKGYAFVLTIRLGEVYLDFTTLLENEYKKIDIWNFCASYFTSEDRKNLPLGKTVEDNIRCTILVLARGLENNFRSMLKGHIEWIDNYKRYPMAGIIKKADKTIVQLIEDRCRET